MKLKLKSIILVFLLSFCANSYATTGKAHDLIKQGNRLLFSNTDSAMYFFRRAEKIARADSDSLQLVRSLSYIALAHQLKGEYKRAVKISFQALSLSREYKFPTESGTILNNLGALYFDLKEWETSEKYYSEALKIMTELHDTVWLSKIYGNFAGVYFVKKKYEKSVELLQKSIDFGILANRIEAVGGAYSNLAMVYMSENKNQKAIESYQKGLHLLDSIDDKRAVCITLNELANLHVKMKKNKKAEQVYLRSLKIARSIKHLESIVSAYLGLAKVKNLEGDYQSAYRYQIKYSQWKDSILDYDKAQIINELNIKYQTEKKEQKLRIKKIQLEEEQKLNQYIIGSLLLLFVAMLFIVYNYLQKQKAYKILVHKHIELINKEKELSKVKPFPQKNAKIQSDSGLNEERKRNLLQEIVLLIEEEKYYLQQKITIDKIAKQLNSNSKYVSQIINENYHTSFSNLINKYRVNKVCELLLNKEYDHFSFEGIAEKAGFSSKSSFNKTFKKITGVTPSYFKKNKKNIEN